MQKKLRFFKCLSKIDSVNDLNLNKDLKCPSFVSILSSYILPPLLLPLKAISCLPHKFMASIIGRKIA